MQADSLPDMSRIEAALDAAYHSIRRNIPRIGTKPPKIGRSDLTYERCGPSDWVASFWSGQLWHAYEQTGDDTFLAAARAQRPYFVDLLTRPANHTHDLGFQYLLSVVADDKITGDREARRLGLAAAESLAKRYNTFGRFIPAWNPWPQDTPEQAAQKAGKIIVDCLENLALLYWAGAVSGDPTYAAIATAHAETSRTFLVRADGSTFHTYDFDPRTGAPRGGFTHQGYADDSCWCRGQAWAIHGFTQIFRYTGGPHFRDTACRLADYAIAHLPADNVPYWDFLLPADAPQYRDSSAGAIMAAGLLALAEAVPNADDAARYRRTAHALLDALIMEYTTFATPEAEGLLLHGASNVNADLSDAMLPYGDYFFVEAMLRALGRSRGYW